MEWCHICKLATVRWSGQVVIGQFIGWLDFQCQTLPCAVQVFGQLAGVFIYNRCHLNKRQLAGGTGGNGVDGHLNKQTNRWRWSSCNIATYGRVCPLLLMRWSR